MLNSLHNTNISFFIRLPTVGWQAWGIPYQGFNSSAWPLYRLPSHAGGGWFTGWPRRRHRPSSAAV